jgi:ribosomal protein S18 acetylase RimI-like enzyme
VSSQLQLVPLRADHLPAAARIFAERLAGERQVVPGLPARAPDAVVDQLARMVSTEASVAALADGRLVGYMTGWCIDAFQGPERGVYCPEWAAGAAGARRGDVLRRMYAHMAREWAGTGCVNHAVTLLASDHEARETLWWLGFGVRVVDALRDVAPIGNAPPDGLAIRRLGPDDADVLTPLAQALADHVAAPPISVHIAQRRDAAFHRAWLSAPGHWVWLAELAGAPVGYVRAQADADDVAWVVQSPEVLAISGAYVLPKHRGRGIATALVDEALALARALGKRACSVDFESQNDPAFAFWPRHFTPVCVSVLRRLDLREAGAAHGTGATP